MVCPGCKHQNASGLSSDTLQRFILIGTLATEVLPWLLGCYLRNYVLLLNLPFSYPLGADSDCGLLSLHPAPLLGTIKTDFLPFVSFRLLSI